MIPTRFTDYIFFNLEGVSRGSWRSEVSKKCVKKIQIKFKMLGICEKIILHLTQDTYELNFMVYFHLIYECVIFYINQALITNKCQMWIKRAKKMEKKSQVYAKKNILHPTYDTYELNFMVYFHLIYECVILYIDQALITNKCKKWIKRAKK